jgi:hypothetical protein
MRVQELQQFVSQPLEYWQLLISGRNTAPGQLVLLYVHPQLGTE